jgi:hypothetical protein
MQRFYEWVTIWNTLHHPNVLPLLGVTMTKHRSTIVSRWMANGSINKFLKVHPTASRLELVRLPAVIRLPLTTVLNKRPT